jgi:hypothetical protein
VEALRAVEAAATKAAEAARRNMAAAADAEKRMRKEMTSNGKSEG